MKSLTVAIVATLALGGVACNKMGSPASFSGLPNPVLLGPKDRIGGGQPLATKSVGEFEDEASWSFAQSQSSDGVTTTTTISTEATGNTYLAEAASKVTKNDTAIDIRITDIMPAAYVVFAGMKAKSYVSVEGDVVRVAAAGGAK